MAPTRKARIQRITAPYKPQREPETHSEVVAEEKARAAHNKKICRLRKRIRMQKYLAIVQIYEDKYGKFVPDSKNAGLVARTAPRVAELMTTRRAAYNADCHDHPDIVNYFVQSRAFEVEFGYRFSPSDGMEDHFKRMASHASTASWLASVCDGDSAKMAEVLSQPLTFNVINPYLEGDERRERFDAKLRGYKAILEGATAVKALHATRTEFPFCIRFPSGGYPELYYDAVHIKHELQEMSLHHWEALHDCVGESRQNPNSPFAKRDPLW
ncbi:hypothetical protein B0H11DRAFT_2245269 [Mycena galericulata]|nr:hypothetical protein B0H11DRAFT_2245269 [Mycena galericulata]